jgi:phosphomannomutase
VTGIFEAYDIRGMVPDQIDEAIAAKVGYSFGHFLGKDRLVVGHDMRLSSPALNEAFVRGAAASGVETADIGLATTPMLYTAIIDGGFDGGAMITASHLAAKYNGFKLCREKAIPLSGESGLPEVEAIFRQLRDAPGRPQVKPHDLVFLEKYLQKLVPLVEHPARVRVVVDAGNGMGGLDTPWLFERFPIYEFVPMYMQPNGEFPNHVPNPTIPENTADLQRRVSVEKATMGIAFDGDCDRCGFVDEAGERVPADLIIAVLAEYFLRKNPGATILYDLRSSRSVSERIHELGGHPVKTRVGHSFIKEKMRETGAVFAGELSGHYYYRDIGFIDSGIVSMISMLNLLALKEVPLSELFRPLQKYAQSGEINLHVQDASSVFTELEATFKDGRQEHLDGLSIEYDDWWFNLRRSNTEPVVRLVIEADDASILKTQQARLLEIIGRHAGVAEAG